MQVAMVWVICHKRNPAGLETPLSAGVLHSLLPCIQTVLLIPTAGWVLSDLSCVFFPLSCSKILLKILSGLRENGQVGGYEEWNYYPATLTLEFAATKMVTDRLFTETRPISQSFKNWTHVLKPQEIPGHRPCKSAPFSEAESIKTAD